MFTPRRRERAPTPSRVLSSRVKSCGPDGSTDADTIADMVSLTLDLLGSSRAEVPQTMVAAKKPPKSQALASKQSAPPRPPPTATSATSCDRHGKTTGERSSTPVGQRSTTPGRMMREADWERTVHRLQTSGRARDARVTALGEEIAGKAVKEARGKRERWRAHHDVATSIMTQGQPPLHQRAATVLAERDANRKQVSRSLMTPKPKRAPSAGRTRDSRTVADRAEWQRRRDERVAQLRSELVAAELKECGAQQQPTPQAGGKASKRLHALHATNQEKKALARVAALDVELAELAGEQSLAGSRVLYPDELGVFNRGMAESVRKQAKLQQYHQLHGMPERA